MVVQKHFFLGKVDTENSMKMVVSKLFDQPEMTKRWSRVVEKSKLYEIGHITYNFDGNCMLISKLISKMIFRVTSDDQSVVKSGQKLGWSEIGHVIYHFDRIFILISKMISKMIF